MVGSPYPSSSLLLRAHNDIVSTEINYRLLLAFGLFSGHMSQFQNTQYHHKANTKGHVPGLPKQTRSEPWSRSPSLRAAQERSCRWDGLDAGSLGLLKPALLRLANTDWSASQSLGTACFLNLASFFLNTTKDMSHWRSYLDNSQASHSSGSDPRLRRWMAKLPSCGPGWPDRAQVGSSQEIEGQHETANLARTSQICRSFTFRCFSPSLASWKHQSKENTGEHREYPCIEQPL